MTGETVHLSYTLVADGSRDLSMLRHIIPWVIREAARADLQILAQSADFGAFKNPPKSLSDRLREALRRFPCDVLFIHRDAEAQPRQLRVQEIEQAIQKAAIVKTNVPVIPVRMTEAWFLVSENAIRRAADNPNGKARLDMPDLRQIESLPNPKEELHALLVTASEKQGRKLKAFRRDINWHVHRIGDYIEDYGRLEQLPAFREFQKGTKAALERILK